MLSSAEQSNHFLTRSLAAYAVHYLARTEVETAANSITDGFDDDRIDAIHYDARERRLYLASKNGRIAAPESRIMETIKKFIGGIRDLVNLSFDRFNAKVNDKREC
jgi:hypothetical protein